MNDPGPIFYDIHEQTKYKIVISRPENMEDLSDMFITSDELNDLIGKNHYYQSANSGERTLTLTSVVTAAVKEWTEKLEGSKKRTLLINDEELLDVLKSGYFSDFIPDTTEFGRHGNRICYAKRYKRKKTKATKGDLRNLWNAFHFGFQKKHGCYPSHIPTYDRHLTMFKAYQKIVGWRAVRSTTDKEQAKFFRQIWDNPEEYFS